jgi:Uma2 family endonuclease
LLIEVTSDSTVNYDRGDKSVDYRSIESLRDLLIVAHDQPSIDHFVRQDKNTWNLTSVQGLEATMELPSIGCRLALAEIFAGVEFAPGARPALRVAKEMDE